MYDAGAFNLYDITNSECIIIQFYFKNIKYIKKKIEYKLETCMLIDYILL